MNDYVLKELINKSFDEIFIIDNNGKVLEVSPNAANLYETDYNNIKGQTVDNLEKQGILNPSVSKIALHKKAMVTMVQYTKSKEKILVSAHPIFDENGQITRVISFSRNITELEMLKMKNKQVSETITLYETELEHLRRQKNLLHDYQKEEIRLLEKISDLNVTLLIQGESGVGKTRFAQLIHEKSSRRKMPFIEVNCGAIPETLLESELFGYEEGAFTGATKGGKKGYFELANNGTILLDEISEIPYHLQVKLLSVLQKQKITRLGDDKEIHVDCRIICASNKNLSEMVKKGQFREDLYFRINVINIDIPPLRKRKSEIIRLINEFTNDFKTKHNINKDLSDELKVWMTQQRWPGNIRELRNYIERRLILSDSKVISLEEKHLDNKPDTEAELGLNEYMEAVEREFIKKMYQKYPSSIKLGKALGISQSTANRKIKQYIN